jgi:hypothetical protein
MWKGPAGPFSACAGEAADCEKGGPRFARAAPTLEHLKSWQDLRNPKAIYPGKRNSAVYYDFELKPHVRAHLVVANMRSGDWEIRPAMVESGTAPTSETATKYGASAAVNAGYFNLKGGGDSASYIVIDGKTVADPHNNKLLTENPKLIPYLDKIFNRGEVRFYGDNVGHGAIGMSKHNENINSIPPVNIVQAGPLLLPEMDAKEEAFIRTDPDGSVFDSIGVNKPAARTAFGITADGRVLMLCVAGKGQDPESSGVTLAELADAMSHLGCMEAINFDGGASSTMFVRFDMRSPGKAVCGKRPETRVKSILMLVPTLKQK